MPADALYFDNQFSRHIKPASFNARFARSYTRSVSMSSILSEIYRDMASVESFNTLHLIFHGGAMRMTDQQSLSSYRMEGMGIMMGNGRITSENINLFRPFYRHINQIYLYSCAIAAGPSSHRPLGESNGFDLCQRLSRTTGAHVYASANVQFIDDVNLHLFNGRVYLFHPDGTYEMPQDIPQRYD